MQRLNPIIPDNTLETKDAAKKLRANLKPVKAALARLPANQNMAGGADMLAMQCAISRILF